MKEESRKETVWVMDSEGMLVQREIELSSRER